MAGLSRKPEALALPRDGGAESIRPADRAQQRVLRDRGLFLREFLSHPREVASVVPSSITLERRLAQALGTSDSRTIVELGPGIGGTTRTLLQTARLDARLLAVELNPVFHALLCRRIDDPRLMVQRGSAEQLEQFLEARRLPPPDAVVSGIPFSTLPADVADRIAAAIARCLAPGGRFVAYQVRAHVACYVRPYLGEPEFSWEWRNTPPVRVFRWTKRRAGGRRGGCAAPGPGC